MKVKYLKLKITIIVVLFCCHTNYSQAISTDFGIPLITNYLPKDYYANVQNWAVIQDNRGMMYFGNVSGVLEYDGINWTLIPVPNNIIRCLAIDEDGRIYVGGINEVGFLAPDEKGKLTYRSLNKFINNDQTEYGDVWKIIPHKD